MGEGECGECDISVLDIKILVVLRCEGGFLVRGEGLVSKEGMTEGYEM